jgi:hypothetical protein
MKMIKIMSAPRLEFLQKKIDDWTDSNRTDGNPIDIKSVSPITFDTNSVTDVYMVTILYDLYGNNSL